MKFLRRAHRATVVNWARFQLRQTPSGPRLWCCGLAPPFVRSRARVYRGQLCAPRSIADIARTTPHTHTLTTIASRRARHHLCEWCVCVCLVMTVIMMLMILLFNVQRRVIQKHINSVRSRAFAHDMIWCVHMSGWRTSYWATFNVLTKQHGLDSQANQIIPATCRCPPT